MKCPKCQKVMIGKGEDITNNGKSSMDFKEYSKNIYWCKKDDIWINIEVPLDEHSKYHSSGAFCGSAGQEEIDHIMELVSKLTDQEVKQLLSSLGINFAVSEDKLDREDYEMVIDEADREDFYREYKKIINSRKRE